MADSPTPIFLLSLPRSGSTLLQRLLASHAEISTSPEPTFLLPLLHLDRASDVVSTFDQRYTAMAVEDFISSLPGGRETYRTELATFSNGLYRSASAPECRYHLDKTPKYHLVAKEIAEVFPDAPIVVLWRNPLSVIASIMNTWGRRPGRWNLAAFRIDLYEGIVNMIRLVDEMPDRVIALRYEDLVADSEATMARLFTGLDLEPDSGVLERFAELRLDGRIQDPNVTSQGFESLRSDRTELWKTVLANPIRRAWSRRYLRWLGPDRLATMGYDLDTLLGEIDQLERSTSFLATDLVEVPYDFASRLLELQLFRLKFRSWRAGRPLLAHK